MGAARLTKRVIALGCVLAVATATDAGALSKFGGASADGSRVFFDSAEPLVAADTDNFYDVYERSGGGVSLISTGAGNPSGAHNAQFVDTSDDGSRAFFITTEALAPTDSDENRSDVYMRSGGVTTQISQNGNSPFAAGFGAASPDGLTVYFTTNTPVAGDGDDFADVFRYSTQTGAIALMSPGSNGNHALFAGASADGAHVYFHSVEDLAGAAPDGGKRDVFEGGASPIWLSRGSLSSDEAFDAGYAGSSANGSKVYVSTREGLTSDDPQPDECMPDPFSSNSCSDVYEVTPGGTTTLASTGPADTDPLSAEFFLAASADGSRVFFTSFCPMTTGEGEGCNASLDDIYERSGGITTLVTPGTSTTDGSFGGISSDGTKVLFITGDSLDGADSDAVTDLYLRAGGTSSLVSRGDQNGNGPYPVVYGGNTPDGATAYFETREALTSADTDPLPTSSDCFGAACGDVYSRTGAATTLVSGPGPGAGSGAERAEAIFDAATASGSHVFFTTGGALAAGDSDGFSDAYQRNGGVTTLLRGTGSPADTDPPETTITKEPKEKSSKRKATFEFTSDEGGSTFTCALDGETESCASPFPTGKLDYGKHRFTVFATDAAGNDDASPEAVSFRVVKKRR